MTVLEICGLSVDFLQDGLETHAVRNVYIHEGAWETVSDVGES